MEGIYGPNEDCTHFFGNNVFNCIDEWEPDFSLFVGDYNVTLCPDLDNRNYIRDNNPHARPVLKNKMNEYGLVDIWRELYPQEKIFTWRKFGQNKQARLDYFLLSSSLVPYVQDAKILPGFNSDHSVIMIDVDFSKFVKGKGFWKFNTSLIKDKEYTDLIKTTIKK